MGELLFSAFNDCCTSSPCRTVSSPSSTCPTICVGDIGVYDTLALLKAAPAADFPTTTAKKIMFVLGLDVVYDGGYRIYVADLANAEVADDYSVVEATNFAGRMKLLFG